MANLKDLKKRINSVKSTQKITSAMKMVAAAKLRRAQENAEQSRPYTERMRTVVADLAGRAAPGSGPVLLVGTGKTDQHLLVVVSADRGLCGGFNSNIIRATRREVERCRSEGKSVKLLMVGRKAADALRREFGDLFLDTIEGILGTSVSYGDVARISEAVQSMVAEGSIDTCAIVYNRFVNAITQEVTHESLVPVQLDKGDGAEAEAAGGAAVMTEYEPSENAVLEDLLPRALGTRIFATLLESSASELAARVTAMDNATRNAGELIDDLTMEYNRSRQAAITTELIEIISGAEAL